MKLVLGFLAVIALTTALPHHGRRQENYGLKEDLNDFLALIPTNEIVSVALDYLMTDPEVQELMEYVQSDEFKKLVQDVEGEKEYIKFLNYLQESGLDAYGAVNKLHEFLGIAPLKPSSRRTSRKGQGIRGLIDDIEALIPMDKMKAMYYDKLETSKDFAALIERMRSDEIKNTVIAMLDNPTIQDIIKRGKEHGLDVKVVIDILNKIFGWGLEETRFRKSTYGLQEDLKDFISLIPVDQIVSVALEYVMTDPEVQELLEYIQSDEFKKLVQDVEGEKEYIKFLNYLQESGLDAYGAVNKLHEFLGLPPLTPTFRRTSRKGQGIRGLIDDIEALIPMDKIKAMYYDKLENSKDFAALIERMRSDEIKNTVIAMLDNPTIQDIIKRGKEHGLDVKVVIDILNKIFGWGLEETRFRKSTYGLQEDLKDFISLIPVDQIVSVALEYVMTDPEVQELLEYVQSDDFKKLVQDVEAEKEYIKFLNYLQESGLDVYGAVNKLHEFLGLPPLTPTSRRTSRKGQGIRGLIDDIEALIPMDKIKAMYYDKLENSKDFAALIERMQSDEIKNTVIAMLDNPTIQDIIKRGKEHGLDVKVVIDILNKIFGWGLEETYLRSSTFSLKEDLNDFLALIPLKDIMNIALDYIFNDQQVQEALEYIQSQEFIDALLEIEAVPQFPKMMKYFQSSGLDVYKALDLLHQFLNIPPFKPSTVRSMPRREPGVRGLIDAIEAIIPFDKIKALFNDKLTSSPDFIEFIKTMKSDEIKSTVQELAHNPKVENLVVQAKKHNIDIKLVFDILNKIFDWGLE